MSYQRKYSLVIGETGGQEFQGLAGTALDVSNLDISFRVTKNLKPEPNTAEFRIWGLGEDARKRFAAPQPTTTTPTTRKLIVRLEAGYVDEGVGQIYLGEVRAAYFLKDGADIVTVVETGDAEAMATARISVSIGAKSPPDVALRQIAKALGVKPGNIEKAATALRTKGAALFNQSVIIHGAAPRAMTDFARSAGLEWSVQDGALQILDVGKAIETTSAISLTGSDIISPTLDSKGILSGECPLIPSMRPGVKISVDTLSVKGGFRVLQCEYFGESSGADWGIRFQAKRY